MAVALAPVPTVEVVGTGTLPDLGPDRTWITRADVTAAAAELYGAATGGAQRVADGRMEGWGEGTTRIVRIGPGVVGLRSQDRNRAEKTHERAAARGSRSLDELDAEAGAPARGVITEWSARSRSRMTEAIAGLDLTALMVGPGDLGMVTFTLPGPWETVAPTGKAFKALVRRLEHRARRAGLPWVGLWKLELQRRGAPHLHVLMRLPYVIGGEVAEAWCGATWAAIVRGAYAAADPDGLAGYDQDHFAGHVIHGVHFSPAVRYDDPRRVGIYFAGHSAKHTGGKEYQHEVPDLWREPGAGPGRFWGVWGLDRAVLEVEVTERQARAVARVLRGVTVARERHIEAQKRAYGTDPLVRVRPAGDRVVLVAAGPDEPGAELSVFGDWLAPAVVPWVRSRPVRRRRVRRSLGHGGGQPGGFVVVNDGPGLARGLVQVIAAC